MTNVDQIDSAVIPENIEVLLVPNIMNSLLFTVFAWGFAAKFLFDGKAWDGTGTYDREEQPRRFWLAWSVPFIAGTITFLYSLRALYNYL